MDHRIVMVVMLEGIAAQDMMNPHHVLVVILEEIAVRDMMNPHHVLVVILEEIAVRDMMSPHHVLVVIVEEIAVQDMMNPHRVLVAAVLTEIFAPKTVATILVPVRCTEIIDRMIAVVMLLIIIVLMIRNHYHRLRVIEKEMVHKAITTMLPRIEISVIDSNLHYHNDAMLDQDHSNMVAIVRDVVVSMALVIVDRHMMIVPDEIGMVQGGIMVVLLHTHRQVRRLAVTAQVRINFIVVIVVAEEDEDLIVVIHVIQEIAIAENTIYKQM
jgi:hypothetical protein